MRFHFSIILLAALTCSAQNAPELLFHAPFDGTAEAALAQGEAKPLAATGLVFVAGVAGQAVRLTAEAKSRLEYKLEKNVDPARGTIAFWYKPEWEDEPGESRRHLFGFTAPWDRQRIGSGAVYVWYYDAALRGDTSDQADAYVSVRRPVASGVWRHIVFTWDEQTAAFTIDGQTRRQKRDNDNPLQEALQGPAKKQTGGRRVYDRLRAFPSFHVGGMREGKQADGLIDDLKIFSAPLSAAQIQALSAECKPLAVSLDRTYFLDAEAVSFTATVQNRSEKTRAVAWQFQGPAGKRIRGSDRSAEVSAAQPLTVALDGLRLEAGRYTFRATGEGALPSERDIWVMGAANPEVAKSGGLNLQLVETLTLDQEPGAERFVSTGGHTFGTLGGVRYLEAGTNRNDRFAVRFRLPDNSPLYCFEWSYPDDKCRTADIIVQPSAGARHNYELQVGTFTGDEFPNQNRILTARCLYWAPTQDVSVVFMTARAGAPAAVSQIRLHKVIGGLPAAKVNTPKPVDGWNRTLGLYYEDPAINYDFAVSGSDMPGFETLINRTAAYMKYSGQNLFAYPGVWYHGRIGEDYNPRGHAEDFLTAWYVKFDAEGLGVMPTFNEQTLPLPEGLTITKKSLSDGSLHDSCVSIWDTGMPNPGGWHGTPPNFNILHPDTQQVIMRELDAMLAQGVGHPSFRGIDLRLAEHCFHWLGSIRTGYNDYMIDAFTQETGIKVPVGRADPLRGKRYAEWLLTHARKEWVGWRCRAVAAWYKRLAARLAQARPDLRLSLTLLTPMHPARGEPFEETHYIDQLNKEAGIDVALFADTPNIVIAQGSRPARYRAGYDRPKTEAESVFLRNVFDTGAYYESLSAAALPWVHLHDHYWESPVGDPKRRSKADKPLAAPWFTEEPWRVTTLNPASFYALRPYVLPLRYHDVLGYTRGGFLIGTYGMEKFLVPFARAFRALPARRFADVPGCTETVKLRMLACDGKTWFYVVNTGDAQKHLTVETDTTDVTDLVTGLRAAELKGTALALRLQPYQLRSFCAEGECKVFAK